MQSPVIDVFAHDATTDQLVLVANEPRPWEGGAERLQPLEEKLNAYVSFLLDGELAETHPELVGKPARIEIRCAHMPDETTLDFFEHVHDQLAFQEIELRVIVKQPE